MPPPPFNDPWKTPHLPPPKKTQNIKNKNKNIDKTKASDFLKLNIGLPIFRSPLTKKLPKIPISSLENLK